MMPMHEQLFEVSAPVAVVLSQHSLPVVEVAHPCRCGDEGGGGDDGGGVDGRREVVTEDMG
jgi:hypothetical protein